MNNMACMQVLTALKIWLSSGSALPNNLTRSDQRFGYAKRLNNIIKASIPVETVPCEQVYFSGRSSAANNLSISSF